MPVSDLARAREMLVDESIEFVNVFFTDLTGRWMRLTWPRVEFDISRLTQGVLASAYATGWRGIQQSDYVFRLDLNSMFSCRNDKSVSFIADIFEPDGSVSYGLDPRGILRRALDLLTKALPGVQLKVGAELEFYIFDEVRFNSFGHNVFFNVTEPEGTQNARETTNVVNRGLVLSHPAYHLAETADYTSEIRKEIVRRMLLAGLHPTHCFHESGPSQAEIGLRFDAALQIADAVQRQKSIVRAVAKEFGKVATYMPKPLAYVPGNGLHLHISLWKDGKNIFFDGENEGRLSSIALSAIGGLLQHTRSLAALCNSSVNSYSRTAQMYDPSQDTYFGHIDRSAAIRVPAFIEPHGARIEARFPDSSANIYLVIAGIICALIDGIKGNATPTKAPLVSDPSQFNTPRARADKSFPISLDEAIESLRKDRLYLLEGGVFSEDFLQSLEKELSRRARLARQPHPSDFVEVLDC